MCECGEEERKNCGRRGVTVPRRRDEEIAKTGIWKRDGIFKIVSLLTWSVNDLDPYTTYLFGTCLVMEW